MLALRSGADTSLIGGTGRADRIIASVGKDLRLETLQDASTYDAKQQSIGVKVNICVYGYCKSSVSGHVAQGRMNSDFRSASEQAGLKAGDGGFQQDIARNTTLVGAAISSSERAAPEGRNALGTGTLDVREVKNTAPHRRYAGCTTRWPTTRLQRAASPNRACPASPLAKWDRAPGHRPRRGPEPAQVRPRQAPRPRCCRRPAD